MEKRKRGELTQNKIIVIIILVIVAAVIILFMVTEYIIGRAAVNKQDCYNTVVARNNAFVRGEVIQQELVPLRCKTEEIKIDSSDEEEIKKTIANAMYDCWWMLGEGRMTFLKDDAYIRPFNKDVSAEKVACLLCSTINFNQKVKEKNLQIDVFDYMLNTKVPIKNITYWDFLSGTENSKQQLGAVTADNTGKINTGQDYAVIFLSAKGGKLGNEVARSISPGLTFGAILGFGVGVALIITGVGAPVGGAIIAAAVGAMAGTLIMGAEGYAEKLNIVSAYCDKDIDGCNMIMLIPQNEQSFATCSHFSNIP